MPCLGLKRKFRGEPSMPETLGSVPSTAKQTNALVGEDALPSDWALFVPSKHRLLVGNDAAQHCDSVQV